MAGPRSGIWKRCCKVFGSDEREARGRLHRKLCLRTVPPENKMGEKKFKDSKVPH